MLIISFTQIVVLYAVGLIMGLTLSINIILSIPFLLLISLLFVSLGLLLGNLLSDTQVGPIGSVLVRVVAFLSGMWFSLDLVGGAFKTIGNLLPFAPAVDMIRQIISGSYNIAFQMWNVLAYLLVILAISILIFKKNMKE